MVDPLAALPQTTPPPAHARRPARTLAAGLAAIALVTGLAAGVTAPRAQAASPGFCSDGSQPYVPKDELRGYTTGAAVTALTVTKGTTPERFTGTYIGFVENGIAKDVDMPLFQFSSPTIDGTAGLKPAGIWAGASGSPVYDADGRLIGAIAYGVNTDNLPVAGITPAYAMKTIGTTAVASAKKVQLTKANLRTTTAKAATVAGQSLSGRTLTQLKTVNFAGKAGAKNNAFANRTLARTPRTADAASLLRSKTFMAAPTATTGNAVPQPLVAGGNIAVLYGKDDLMAGSIGTVTAICGNTVWAFGHPMAFTGKTSLYMANASVAMIVPDGTGLVGSYKQTQQIGAPVGMITEDRLAGLRGTIGASSGIDVSVRVQNKAGTTLTTYSGGISDPQVAAAGTAFLVGTAAQEQLDQSGAGTGEVTWTISYRRANGKTGSFTNTQIVSDRTLFPDEIGTPPADDVWELVEQPHENITITRVGVTLRLISDQAESYEIGPIQRYTKGAWRAFNGSQLKPGGSYTVRTTYRFLRNDRLVTTVAGSKFTVALAKSARSKGTLKVSSLRGEDACSVAKNGEVTCVEFGLPTELASNFDELVALLDSQRSDKAVLGTLNYKLTKGSKTKNYSWTGPGRMTGLTTASFTIKK